MTDKLVKANNPLVKKLSDSLRVGSLTDLVRVRQAENILLLLDVSGSMADIIGGGKYDSDRRSTSRRRIDGLRETVKDIQSEKELKMVQFGYGHEPSFITSIPDPSGGTPLHLAIDFARTNNCARAIVISDGMPDNENLAMDAAQRFGGRIDVVFIGNPGERGELFLKRLAESTGGESFTGDLTLPKELAGKVMGLLGDGDDDDDDDDGVIAL